MNADVFTTYMCPDAFESVAHLSGPVGKARGGSHLHRQGVLRGAVRPSPLPAPPLSPAIKGFDLSQPALVGTGRPQRPAAAARRLPARDFAQTPMPSLLLRGAGGEGGAAGRRRAGGGGRPAAQAGPPAGRPRAMAAAPQREPGLGRPSLSRR